MTAKSWGTPVSCCSVYFGGILVTHSLPAQQSCRGAHLGGHLGEWVSLGAGNEWEWHSQSGSGSRPNRITTRRSSSERIAWSTCQAVCKWGRTIEPIMTADFLSTVWSVRSGKKMAGRLIDWAPRDRSCCVTWSLGCFEQRSQCWIIVLLRCGSVV